MNHMKEIAEMLGVEMGEEFKIKTTHDFWDDIIFHIDEDGVCGDKSDDAFPVALNALLVGAAEIIKLPWRPKKGKEYYYFSSEYGIGKADFSGATFDIMAVISGNCFRTREEAEAHQDEIMAKFKEFM